MDATLFNNFNHKTVLITGATGFIGGRLLELLAEHTTANIRLLVRDYGKAMRAGRYPVTMIKGDVNDSAIVREAVRGCDYILHCAYGNKGSAESRNKVNVEGTLNLLHAAKEEGVSALVFLSTVSVYELTDKAQLNELSLVNPHKEDEYAISKLEAEKQVLDFATKNNFHATVLQPTAVYGPWSPSYVMRPLASLQQFKFPLINAGKGTCNAVYVDDLCQAIFLAAITAKAAGQKYLINGPEHFSWKEFYTALAAMIPDSELVNVSVEEMKRIYLSSNQKKPLYKIFLQLLKLNKDAVRELLQYSFFSDLAGFAFKNLPAKILQKIRPSYTSGAFKNAKKVMALDPQAVKFFTSITLVNHTKAIDELGYKPEFGKNKSFDSIRIWVKWYFKLLDISSSKS